MSVEMYAFLNQSDLPSRNEWQAAIDSLGLPVVLDEQINPRDTIGYSPCALRGGNAGFEYSVERAKDLGPPDSARHFDSAAVFRWSGDLAECASAMAAAAALLRHANVVVFCPEDDLIYSLEGLLADFDECVNELGSPST